MVETVEDIAHFFDDLQLLRIVIDQIFADEDDLLGCGLYSCKGVGVLHVDDCVGVIFDDYLLHVVGMEYLYRYYSYPIDTAYNKYTHYM